MSSKRRVKCSCIECKKELQPRYLKKHKCKEPKSGLVANRLDCEFCGKVFNDARIAVQHRIRCKYNPKSIVNSPSKLPKKSKDNIKPRLYLNQFDKAKKLGLPKPIVSQKTRAKISEANKRQIWSDERKLKHSCIMKEVVAKHPESYNSSNRGRIKQIIYNDIKFQGQWELDFYKWAISNDLTIRRVTEGFPYTWKGERTYFPDFYIESLDLYVEVKGYKTDRDEAKWTQFPHKLLVVDKHAIDKIHKNTYNINS